MDTGCHMTVGEFISRYDMASEHPYIVVRRRAIIGRMFDNGWQLQPLLGLVFNVDGSIQE